MLNGGYTAGVGVLTENTKFSVALSTPGVAEEGWDVEFHGAFPLTENEGVAFVTQWDNGSWL